MHNLAVLDLLRALWQTLYMVFISSFLSIVFGVILGVALFITRKKALASNAWIYQPLGFLVNVVRSVPFIILMISIIPLTRLLAGTTIGTNAAIVPLTIAAIPFFARIAESAMSEVPKGLIEAAEAMGASTRQIVWKVLLPESLPALLKGATLTIIGLVGYSAMAGTIGGGGLGELAINYGYQQFNVWVMAETVIILIALVQLVQSLGDRYAKRRKIKTIVIASIVAWVICIGSIVWPVAHTPQEILKVGIMSGVGVKIFNVAKRVAKQKYNLDLQVVTFDDYVLPNTALSDGDIDANIFQHLPYLKAQKKARGYDLLPIAKTFIYPMGFYSRKIKNIKQLPEGAVVAIPNDPSNEGRSLIMLQKAGLIKLKSGVGLLGTVRDIVENPKHLQIKLLAAAQLPHVLKDATLVVLTNDFVTPTGFTPDQAILKEGAKSPYANIIVVRRKDQDNPAFKALVAVMHSKPVVDATLQVFPKGLAIRAW